MRLILYSICLFVFVCFLLSKAFTAWNGDTPVLFVSQCQHITSESHRYKVGNPNWRNLLFSVKRANKAFTSWGRVMVWHQRFVCVYVWVSECVFVVFEVWGAAVTSDTYYFSTENLSSRCRETSENLWGLLPSAAVGLFCASWLVLHFPLKTLRLGFFGDSPIDPECLVFCVRLPKRVIGPRAASHLIDCLHKQPERAAFLSFNLCTLELLLKREHLVSFVSFKPAFIPV